LLMNLLELGGGSSFFFFGVKVWGDEVGETMQVGPRSKKAASVGREKRKNYRKCLIANWKKLSTTAKKRRRWEKKGQVRALHGNGKEFPPFQGWRPARKDDRSLERQTTGRGSQTVEGSAEHRWRGEETGVLLKGQGEGVLSDGRGIVTTKGGEKARYQNTPTRNHKNVQEGR